MEVSGRSEVAVKLPRPVALEVNRIDKYKSSEIIENVRSNQITYHLVGVLGHPAVDLICTAICIAPENIEATHHC